MVNPVKELFQIKVYYPTPSALYLGLRLLHRLSCIATQPLYSDNSGSVQVSGFDDNSHLTPLRHLFTFGFPSLPSR
ncbi:hypothetical protein SSYM_2569 [Serratia symbiotica str. Tucson]|uniref:Uncharacterized protein n=1 Tax=Serratia symbiotica str. Tucson TaxID=914128 RepID=E9CPT1_9GAMM|nr:hypothetical protein SSYM_2569 [Serratia symbiotica str. Tucson]